MEKRTHKLLVMVGEEGADVEARDYRKLSEVIVSEYLAEDNASFRNVTLPPRSICWMPSAGPSGPSPSKHTSTPHSPQTSPEQYPPLPPRSSRQSSRGWRVTSPRVSSPRH